MFKLLVPALALIILPACNESLSKSDVTNVEFCKLFKLSTEPTTYKGAASISLRPEIIYDADDKVFMFIRNQEGRFSYLLYKLLSRSSVRKFYPDTLKMQEQFCKELQNKKFASQFEILTGVNAKENSDHPLIYSKKEMMKTASRFFMCDQINKVDTSVNYRICVGINGVKELKAEKDYTVLEAFCFAAIFHFNRKNKTPRFISNFHNYIIQTFNSEKNKFSDFTSHLNKVKEKCYVLMENDSALESALLQYHDENKSNIGFSIR